MKKMVLLTDGEIDIARIALEYLQVELWPEHHDLSDVQMQVMRQVRDQIDETLAALGAAKEPPENVVDFRKRF